MGRFRTPAGSIVNVDDALANLIGSTWTSLDGIEPAARSALPDASWKAPDLKAYATEHQIELGDATKKDDVLAAIELHLESITNV